MKPRVPKIAEILDHVVVGDHVRSRFDCVTHERLEGGLAHDLPYRAHAAHQRHAVMFSLKITALDQRGIARVCGADLDRPEALGAQHDGRRRQAGEFVQGRTMLTRGAAVRIQHDVMLQVR